MYSLPLQKHGGVLWSARKSQTKLGAQQSLIETSAADVKKNEKFAFAQKLEACGFLHCKISEN